MWTLRSAGLVLFLHLLGPVTAHSDCGSKWIRVESADPEDRRIACAGAERTLTFASRCGAELSRPVRIAFMEPHEREFLAAEGSPHTETPPCGYYLANTCSIIVESSRIPVEDRIPAFEGLPTSKEFLISTVAHEVTHHVYHCLCAARGQKMDLAHAEYLAYVVQFSTMAQTERTEVLGLWPQANLPGREAINSVLWSLDPPRFGVMAYRYHRTDPALFCDILAGRLRGLDLWFFPSP